MRTVLFSCAGLPRRAALAADLFNELSDPSKVRALSADEAADLAVLGVVYLLVTMDVRSPPPAVRARHRREWPLLSPACIPDGSARATELLQRHVCGLIVRAGWDRGAVLPPA